MCNKFRKIESYYKMLEMLYKKGDNALYSINFDGKDIMIDAELSNTISEVVKKHYMNKIKKLNETLLVKEEVKSEEKE